MGQAKGPLLKAVLFVGLFLVVSLIAFVLWLAILSTSVQSDQSSASALGVAVVFGAGLGIGLVLGYVLAAGWMSIQEAASIEWRQWLLGGVILIGILAACWLALMGFSLMAGPEPGEMDGLVIRVIDRRGESQPEVVVEVDALGQHVVGEDGQALFDIAFEDGDTSRRYCARIPDRPDIAEQCADVGPGDRVEITFRLP